MTMSNSGNLLIPVEADMKKKTYEEAEKLSSKVFKVYPLVGDYMPKEKTLDNWFNVTRQYLEKRLENKSAKFYPWVYEQVTLVIIHYAKGWNSTEEGRFSKYIAMQLGYRDENGRIWSLLTDAIGQAFKQNNRLFITRNNERQFYETIMVHSFGPAGAWYPLIDLLFTFYTDNLDWTYVPGDPLFVKLINVLQGYFNNTEVEDDQYNIASQKYSLRVGIRRLVQERPGYCIKQFELIVKRIQQLIGNEATEAKRYRNTLVDQWFADRISKSMTPTRRVSSVVRAPQELALDYSKVTVRYVISEGRLSLRIPAIRIVGDEKGIAVAELHENNRLISSNRLEIRGNELGETIQQKTIILPKLTDIKDELLYRVVIKRGDSVLFDSDNKLHRQIIFISEGKEINVNKIRKEKYEAFVPNPSKVNAKNVDITAMTHGMVEMAFHKDYVLEYAGNVVALDMDAIKGIRIVSPGIFENVRLVLDGDDRYILRKETSLKVYFEGKKEASKYAVVINGESHPLTKFYDAFAENRAIIPLNNDAVVAIMDISSGRTLFRENYSYIPDFNIEFNKEVYVTDEDYEDLSVRIHCEGEDFYVDYTDGNEARVEYREGVIVADIPRIKTSFEGIATLFFNKYIRSKDITEQSFLRISASTGIRYTLTIGGKEIGDKQLIPLNSFIEGECSNNDKTDIVLHIGGKEYFLGRIVYGNCFTRNPKFTFSDNTLYWDGGASYIGDADEKLTLSLIKDRSVHYSIRLKLGDPLIHKFEDEEFIDGRYEWKIFADDIQLLQGSDFIGNESKARFSNSIIQIDFVTEDIEESSKAVPIKTVYIDQIVYIDTCYVETEEGVYDVYSGCMYWVDWNGEKRYYSFKYNEARSKYKVNPVKIIYISDKYLRIVNADNEGIYYFYKDIPPNIGNEITDREPSVKARNYHDILFYLFKIKGTGETPKENKKETSENPVRPQPVAATPLKKIVEPVKRPTSEQNATFKSLKTVPQSVVIEASVNERILVNAGPGTGKTWTLIERIIHLVQSGVDPETIQVLCFSRAAVEVIRNRMADAVSEGRAEVSIHNTDIRTFDSFASQLLYWVKDSDYKEINENFRIESLNYEQRIGLFDRILLQRPGLIEQCAHLIVDEVQDLVLRRAKMVIDMINSLPADSGVTLFGDACQAIYDYQVDIGLSSDDFYKEIENTGQFKYYSFEHNYRQTSALQSFCEEYREAILDGDINSCNAELSNINEQLPEFFVNNLLNFDESSLEGLLKSGNVGILTRSNAQALYISALFHRKNISHTLQRRLADNCLAGWIAVLFNKFPMNSYDEEGFISSFNLLFPDGVSGIGPKEIWNAITNVGNDYSGRIPVSDLLQRIRRYGKNAALYSDIQNNNVTLSTIHRSKGREYDSVIILNNLISDQTDTSEEHRVNYVALSRAKQKMYKVELHDIFFKTLENRRCYSIGKNYGKKRNFLSRFEIGKNGDFAEKSFCNREGVQEYIQMNINALKGKEVYLKKDEEGASNTITYSLILKENDMILGKTGDQFGKDLEDAIRRITNLPWYAPIFPYVFPKRFNGIFISDVVTEIGMALGNEIGIREFGNLTTWNIVLAEGYAKAEY